MLKKLFLFIFLMIFGKSFCTIKTMPEHEFKQIEKGLVHFHNVAHMLTKNILIVARIRYATKSFYYTIEDKNDLTNFMTNLPQGYDHVLYWYCQPCDNPDILKEIEFIY